MSTQFKLDKPKKVELVKGDSKVIISENHPKYKELINDGYKRK